MTTYTVNETDASWAKTLYVLGFDAYGETHLEVFANSLDKALNEAIDWIVDNKPGILCDEQVNEAYHQAILGGASEEEAHVHATADTTVGGNEGHYVLSHEWCIISEKPNTPVPDHTEDDEGEDCDEETGFTLDFKYCECGCHCSVASHPVMGETLDFTIYNDLRGNFTLYKGHGTLGPQVDIKPSFEAAAELAAKMVEQHPGYRE